MISTCRRGVGERVSGLHLKNSEPNTPQHAIHLNHQASLDTHKINHARHHGFLPPKLEPHKAMRAQVKPQTQFSVSLVGAQSLYANWHAAPSIRPVPRNLCAMHQPPRRRIKRIAAVHGAAVIPDQQITHLPLLYPCRLGPYGV